MLAFDWNTFLQNRNMFSLSVLLLKNVCGRSKNSSLKTVAGSYRSRSFEVFNVPGMDRIHKL